MALRSVSTPIHGLLDTSMTLNQPAGYQVGDILLAFFTEDVGVLDHANTTFTGWTFIVEIVGGTDGENLLVWGRIATGSENWVASTTTVSAQTTAVVGAWSGRSQAIPSVYQTSHVDANAASPVSISLTGITAANGDDIAVWVGLDQAAQTDTWGFSTITNYVKQVDYASSDWDSDTLQTRDAVGAGATGSLTLTATQLTGSSQTAWLGVVIALSTPPQRIITPVTSVQMR
jgi:hypothetical protein